MSLPTQLSIHQGRRFALATPARSVAHGEPRATIDLDVVIAIDLADLPTLAANFEAQGFYVAGLADVMAGSLRCLNITI